MSTPLAEPVSPSTALPRVGDIFRARDLETLHTTRVHVPDRSRLVHLQLRRFAGCPICNLHLRTFARRHSELLAAGVVEVAVFHSSAEALREVHTDLPFAVVPDPSKRLYAELGVGSSLRAKLDPRAMVAAARAMASGAATHPTMGAGDGSLGLPGDFPIAPNGRIVALHRGVHADDQWSVADVLRLAGEHNVAAADDANQSGEEHSRAASGDGPEHIAPALLIAAIALTSWALRPAWRRLPDLSPLAGARP